MKGKSYGSTYSQISSSYQSKSVDTKLIAEDFKKYEDKTTKKIKDGNNSKFINFIKIYLKFYFYRWNGKDGHHLRNRYLHRCKNLF